jgi:adenine-specific DNA methylase
MDETFKVTCPDCGTILVVRRRDGKVLEVRKPLLEESTGDRFEDAFLKVKHRPKEVDEKISAAKQKEKDRLKGADDFFKQALARAKESDEKPVNPLDQT